MVSGQMGQMHHDGFRSQGRTPQPRNVPTAVRYSTAALCIALPLVAATYLKLPPPPLPPPAPPTRPLPAGL